MFASCSSGSAWLHPRDCKFLTIFGWHSTCVQMPQSGGHAQQHQCPVCTAHPRMRLHAWARVFQGRIKKCLRSITTCWGQVPAGSAGLRQERLGAACAGNPALKMQHWIKSLPHDNIANEWEHMIRDKSNVAAQHSAQLAQRQRQQQQQEQAHDAQSDAQAATEVSPAG